MGTVMAYLIGPVKWQQYFNRDGYVSCECCGSDIGIGDAVASHRTRKKLTSIHTRLFCAGCALEKVLIVESDLKDLRSSM